MTALHSVKTAADIDQLRRQHALVVARDDFRLLRLHVRDGEERGFQLTVVIDHRKVMLMMNHRRRQHFFGKLEKLDGEMAGDDGRIFDKVGHFLQQRRVGRHEA